MSRANAPHDENDAVYAEVDKPHAEKFSIDENVCYGGIKSALKDSTEFKGEQFSHRTHAAKVFLVLFVLVIALLLGTVCACIAFALDITNLKSELALSQMVSSSQQLNTSETNAENLTQQIAYQLGQLNGKIQYLDSLIDSSLQQFNLTLDNKTRQLNASTQRLIQQLNENFNTSIDSFLQQFSQDHFTLDNKIQQLNASTQQITQELNASVTLFNQQHSQSHITLDGKIELLNSSIYSSQEQFRQNTEFLTNLFHGSCTALSPFSRSGYYTILPPRGPPTEQVYCDFNRQCGCGGSSAWTRVAFLNMSDPNEVCPSNWETYTSPVRACGNGENNSIRRCNSVIYPAYGLRYNRVCGRVIGYQNSDTHAFSGLIDGLTIEQRYLDGVSITHGGAGSRQHIWSFTSAVGNASVTPFAKFYCSCSSSNNWPHSTSFVGNDYFCDTGNHGSRYSLNFFASEPLFDGAGCVPSSTCCTFNNPPWFCKTLTQPSTDDLEVRICDTGLRRDTPIQLLEIFVQ